MRLRCIFIAAFVLASLFSVLPAKATGDNVGDSSVDDAADGNNQL